MRARTEKLSKETMRQMSSALATNEAASSSQVVKVKSGGDIPLDSANAKIEVTPFIGSGSDEEERKGGANSKRH